jgi:guanidinobutyrase
MPKTCHQPLGGNEMPRFGGRGTIMRLPSGTPEIGGLSIWQALEIVRRCRGLDLVGCDLVEVSPPYDPSGNTALIGANLPFEMLCVLAGVEYRA